MRVSKAAKQSDTRWRVTMAQYTPLSFEINLQPEGFMFDVGSLFEALCGLHDQRDARGLRYSLTTVLSYLVLAKLAGENHLRGIAQWVDRRKEQLAKHNCIPVTGMNPAPLNHHRFDQSAVSGRGQQVYRVTG